MQVVSFLLTKKAIDAYHKLVGVPLDDSRIKDEFSSFYLRGNLIVTRNALFVFEDSNGKSIITFCAPKKPGHFNLTRSPIIKNKVSVKPCNGSQNKLVFLKPVNIKTL